MTEINQDKPSHGGKRKGAGRPTETLSVRQVNEMRAKMKERAKITGKDENDILIDWIQASEADGATVDIGIRDRIACMRIWKEYTSPKITEGGEADKIVGPSIFLPEEHPRLEVIDGGKADDDESA